MRRRKWFIIVAVVLVVGVAYAAFLFFGHQGADSLTVSEVSLQAESLHDQQVRVEGRVVPGSVEWDDKTQVIRFVLTDDRETLSIIYQGIVPDNFKPGNELEVQGSYRSDGTFEARSFGKPSSFCSFCH